MVTFPPFLLAASISSLSFVKARMPSRIPPTAPAEPESFGVTGEGVPGQGIRLAGALAWEQPASTIRIARVIRFMAIRSVSRFGCRRGHRGTFCFQKEFAHHLRHASSA